jgi:hypothetical protein
MGELPNPVQVTVYTNRLLHEGGEKKNEKPLYFFLWSSRTSEILKGVPIMTITRCLPAVCSTQIVHAFEVIVS